METDCSRDFGGIRGFLFWSSSYVELLAPAGCGALSSQPQEHKLGWHHACLFPRICELLCHRTQLSVSSALRIKMLCKASFSHKIKETTLQLLTLQGFLGLLDGHSVYGSCSKCKQDRVGDAASLLLFIRGNVWCLKLQYWEGAGVLHFLFYPWDYF